MGAAGDLSGRLLLDASRDQVLIEGTPTVFTGKVDKSVFQCRREPLGLFQLCGELLQQMGLLLRAFALITMTIFCFLVKTLRETQGHLINSHIFGYNSNSH